MQFKKTLPLAAIAATAAAQNATTNMTLPMVLSNQTDLTNLTTFVGLVPNLLSTLQGASNITILAPSNEAFATYINESGLDINSTDPAIIGALLQYHVLNGTFPASSITNQSAFVPTLLTNTAFTNVTTGQVVEAVAIDGSVYFYSGFGENSTVTTADLNYTGGVIHIIDRVLTIPANVSENALTAGLSAAYGALNATGLVDTVDTAPDLTIFVPDNEAFQAIGSALPNLTTDQLTQILEYHVVNGTVGYSSDLTDGQTLTALNGGQLRISIVNGSVFVNSAQVINPNILVANGVVHVIDNVLNPGNATATPVASATAGAPAFTGASTASDVPFTSGVPEPTTSLAGGAAAGSSAASASASSTGGAWSPVQTGAIGAAALFAAGNVLFNV